MDTSRFILFRRFQLKLLIILLLTVLPPQMAKLLLVQGQCCVDPLNNRRQTPLLLAVSQGHAPLVELLTEAGADVTAADEDGDTGIHVACLKLHSIQGEANSVLSPNIFNVNSFIYYFEKLFCIFCQLFVADPAIFTFEWPKS